MKRNLLLIFSAGILFLFFQNCGQMGANFESDSESTFLISSLNGDVRNNFQLHKIAKAKNKITDITYHEPFHDFNGDGNQDSFSCSKEVFFQITNGTKTLKKWDGPAEKSGKINIGDPSRKAKWRQMVYSGCDAAPMGNGKSILLLGHFWSTYYKEGGKNIWKQRGFPWVVFHDGTRFIRKTIKIEGQTKPYRGATRSIKCHAYPDELVKMGYKPGALCFLSDYALTLTGGTYTTLLKLEYSGDGKDIVFKDISKAFGGLWSGGSLGTPFSAFSVGPGFSTYNQHDGAYMMDSAFVDFDKDGLVDLFTVGQHASMRAHNMTIDASYAEGFRFDTTVINSVSKYNGEMTDALRVRSISKYLPLKSTCVYISGEDKTDHIRCFHSDKWVKYNLPKHNKSLGYNAKIGLHKRGLIINTKHNGKLVQFKIPQGTTTVP